MTMQAAAGVGNSYAVNAPATGGAGGTQPTPVTEGVIRPGDRIALGASRPAEGAMYASTSAGRRLPARGNGDRNDELVDAAAAGGIMLAVAASVGALVHLGGDAGSRGENVAHATAATQAAFDPRPVVAKPVFAEPKTAVWNNRKHAGPAIDLREASTRLFRPRDVEGRTSGAYASEVLLGRAWRPDTATDDRALTEDSGSEWSARTFAALHNRQLADASASGAKAKRPVSARPLRAFTFTLADAADEMSYAELLRIDQRGMTFRELPPAGAAKTPAPPLTQKTSSFKAAALFGDADRFAVKVRDHWAVLRYHKGAWRVVDGLNQAHDAPAALPPALQEQRRGDDQRTPVTEKYARGAMRALRTYLRDRHDAFAESAGDKRISLAIPLGR